RVGPRRFAVPGHGSGGVRERRSGRGAPGLQLAFVYRVRAEKERQLGRGRPGVATGVRLPCQGGKGTPVGAGRGAGRKADAAGVAQATTLLLLRTAPRTGAPSCSNCFWVRATASRRLRRASATTRTPSASVARARQPDASRAGGASMTTKSASTRLKSMKRRM